jgi:hypothetical protein
MKPGTKRVMRVATTFTGAAAAAVALNPAAMAATGKAEAHATNQLRRAVTHGNRRLSGSIREGDCTNSHWMHLEQPYNSGECFGYHGLLDLSPYPNARAYCGGNNSGIFWGSGPGNNSYYWFYQGKTYAHLPKTSPYFYVREIGIIAWKGEDTCPPL